MTDSASQHLNLDNALWQFALEHWQSEAIQSASLALQADGWVVSHMLVALWRAQNGSRWNAREPADIARWRKGYTAPLRQLRQSLAKDEIQAGLRRHIAAAELEAERIELALWYRHFEQTAQKSTEGTTDNTKKNDERPTSAAPEDPFTLAALNLVTLARTYHRGHNTSLLQALLLAFHPSLRLDRAKTLLDACSNTLEEFEP